MNEITNTKKIVNKSIAFEKSGETLSIQIELNNVSPNVKKEAVLDVLDSMYTDVKESILPW